MNRFFDLCREFQDYGSSGKGAAMELPVLPQELRFYFREMESYNNWDIPFCHGKYIFVYMLSGNRTVNIGDCSFFLEKGDVILIPPFARHVFCGEKLPFQSLMAAFTLPEKDERLQFICKRKFHFRRHELKNLEMAAKCFHRWKHGELFAGEEAVCYFALLLRQLQNMVLPEMSSNKIFDHDYPLLSRIVEYLSANRDHHVTLKELSTALHVSGSTIRQAFQKKMKQSIGHYQLIQRLNLGCELLKSTDLSIAEIAFKVGFALPNSFLRALKRETGLPPSALRAKYWKIPQ